MSMDLREFKEYLLLHGAELDQWPEEIRQQSWDSLQNSSELRELLEEQERFEKVLKGRKYEEPDKHLAQRIVSFSLSGNIRSRFSLGIALRRLYVDEFYLPKPVFIAVSVLVMVALIAGFSIGFSSPKTSFLTQSQPSLQAFLLYEEDGL